MAMAVLAMVVLSLVGLATAHKHKRKTTASKQ
jgi:hypothetical protein